MPGTWPLVSPTASPDYRECLLTILAAYTAWLEAQLAVLEARP